mgnify:CR=1 FL=1
MMVDNQRQPKGLKVRKIKGYRTIVDSPRLLCGRSGGIRTRDPLHPMQVRYQAALHPE